MSRDLASLGRHDSWDGVRAVVAGFGVSGFAAADNLNHMGAAVTALDEITTDERAEKAELLEVLGAKVRLGEGATADPARRRGPGRHLARVEAVGAAARPGPRARRPDLGRGRARLAPARPGPARRRGWP